MACLSVCLWVTDRICDGQSPIDSGVLADSPLVSGCVQLFDKFPKLLWSISTKARHYAVEQQDNRDYRNYIGQEEAREAERTNQRSGNEQHESPKEHQGDGRRSAPCYFEYADALSGINRILEHSSSLRRRKMMERGEHRAKSLQFTGHIHRVHRIRIDTNVTLRSDSDPLRSPKVWVLICEPNVDELSIRLQFARKIRPWSPAARTH